MCALKRIRSERRARRDIRNPDAVFSINPLGWKSRFTRIRVSRSPKSWNVITPTFSAPSSLRQAIRSFGVWSVISAFHLRRRPQMFSCHTRWVSSICSICSTRCMNSGNCSNWVHSLYATSIGTPTSIASWIGSRRPRPVPSAFPPPLLPPVTLSITDSAALPTAIPFRPLESVTFFASSPTPPASSIRGSMYSWYNSGPLVANCFVRPVAAFFTTGVNTPMAASRATFFISDVTVWVASLVRSFVASLTLPATPLPDSVSLLSLSATVTPRAEMGTGSPVYAGSGLCGLWLRLSIEQVLPDRLPIGREHLGFGVLPDPVEVPDRPVQLLKRILSRSAVALQVVGLFVVVHARSFGRYVRSGRNVAP